MSGVTRKREMVELEGAQSPRAEIRGEEEGWGGGVGEGGSMLLFEVLIPMHHTIATAAI